MDKNNWPDNIDFPMVVRTYNHFGVAPYWDSTNPEEETGGDVISGVVTPARVLSSIAVTPTMPGAIVLGSAMQFTAIGTYSDRSTADITSKVTWISSNNAIVTLSSEGLATGAGIGITILTASMLRVISPAISLRTIAKPTSSPLPEKEMASV
jgi:hypothetical protein